MAAHPQHAIKTIKHTGQLQQTERQTRTARSGLIFPVSRIRRKMRDYVYFTAVLEYCVAEICELAGNACHSQNKKRINSRHVMLAIRNDDELNALLKNVVIAESGVVPSIHEALLPKDQQRNAPSETPQPNA